MSGKVLLSFDVEEFDFPRERGQEITLKEGVKVSSEGLTRVLKMLEECEVKATFFCTGNFAESRSDLILKIKNAGHEVACHGVDHFKYDDSDYKKSKQILERVSGSKVYGYRQPRMFKIDYDEMKKCGYLYDSSVNPAFIPGRYNHTDVPRKAFVRKGVYEVPTSVATFLRVPLFWLALHMFPVSMYVRLSKMSLKKTGYFATYFHPWEFSDSLKKYKVVPFYIKKNSGMKLISRLSKVLLKLKKNNEFVTYAEYVESIKK